METRALRFDLDIMSTLVSSSVTCWLSRCAFALELHVFHSTVLNILCILKIVLEYELTFPIVALVLLTHRFKF